MWTVIELNVSGTIRRTYTAQNAVEVEEKTTASLEGILGRPLADWEREKFHRDCHLEADGRALSYCAHQADPVEMLLAW
jgi:hypothetical protein